MRIINFKRFKVKVFFDNIATGYKVIQDNVIVSYILPIFAFTPKPKKYYSRGENKIIEPKFVVVIPCPKTQNYRCFSFGTFKKAKEFVLKNRDLNNFTWKWGDIPESNDEVYFGHVEI